MATKGNDQTQKLRIAAELYFAEPGVSWQAVADKIGIRRETLWEWRQTEQWEIVRREVVAELMDDDLHREASHAWRRLLKSDNPTVVLRTLEQLGYMGAQQVGIKHSGEVRSVTIEAKDLALAAQLLADSLVGGDGDSGGDQPEPVHPAPTGHPGSGGLSIAE